MARRAVVTFLLACIAGAACPSADGAVVIDRMFLRESGLEVLWQRTVAVDRGEWIRELVVLGDATYLATNRQYVYALDTDDGRLLFGEKLALRGIDMLPLHRRGDTLYVMTGQRISELDARTGAGIGRMTLPFGLAGAPVFAFGNIYMPGVDGRLHVYDMEERLPEWQGVPDRNAAPVAVAATENLVVFVTRQGAVIAVLPSEPRIEWQYDTGGVEAGVVAEPDAVYIASTDTNLYKLDAATGRVIWNFMTGHQLDLPPRVTATTVYQPSGDNGVYALDKETGRVLWQEEAAVDLLCETDSSVYLMGRNQTIVVVDRGSARRAKQVNAVGIDLYHPNTESELIYIGSSMGAAACLRPLR